MRSLYLISLIFILISFSGCSYERVVSDLDQKQANKIVAALSARGLQSIAQTDRASRGKYYVEVSKGDYALAVSILNELGLPRENTPSFRDLTEQKGFLPNTREVEAARLDYALGVEIEEKLKSIPGIESVKVVVRSNLIKGSLEPSASVLIASLDGVVIDSKQVVDMVALMIPGLLTQRVAVWIQPVSAKGVTVGNDGVYNQKGTIVHRALVPFLKYFRVADGDARPLAGAVLGIILLAGIVCFIFGYVHGGRVTIARYSQTSNSPGQLARLSTDRVGARIRIDSGTSRKDDLPGEGV